VDKLKWYQQDNPVFSPAYRVSAHRFAGSESCSIENGRQQQNCSVMSLRKRGREGDYGRRSTRPR
jgi:hypothetical protein